MTWHINVNIFNGNMIIYKTTDIRVYIIYIWYKTHYSCGTFNTHRQNGQILIIILGLYSLYTFIRARRHYIIIINMQPMISYSTLQSSYYTTLQSWSQEISKRSVAAQFLDHDRATRITWYIIKLSNPQDVEIAIPRE